MSKSNEKTITLTESQFIDVVVNSAIMGLLLEREVNGGL